MKNLIFAIVFVIIISNTVFCDNVTSTSQRYEDDIKMIIEKNLNQYYKGNKGEFGIFVKELNSRLSCGYNERKVLNSASTVKLFMASVVYDLDNVNNLKLDSIITDPYTGKKYNLKNITHKMVSHSVNDYFNILFRYIGKKKTNDVVSELGALNTCLSNEIEPSSLAVSRKTNLERYGTSTSPTTTAHDLALFLELAYTNAFGDENSQLLIDSLLKNIYHDRLPLSINFESPVAHKTGTCSGSVYNDAGIVYLEGNPYIIVILSKKVKSNSLGTIRKISKDIYDYHKRRAIVYQNEDEKMMQQNGDLYIPNNQKKTHPKLTPEIIL